MRNKLTFVCLLVCLFFSNHSNAWGFYGHRKINEIAVFTLPKPLFGFYKYHVDYIRTHAVDADSRRYMVKEEACRHFLDGDFYECCVPIDTIPQKYKDAVLKYTEDSVLAHGIVPWHIQTMMWRLTEAFKAKDIVKILKYSADLGHYVADCHVPLHASSNYNGQKTNQVGIHALWESRLPELFNESYDFMTGLAQYEENPKLKIWKAYEESFGLVDSVLRVEKRVSLLYEDDLKYAYETRGNQVLRVYSKAFSESYHQALGNMVEQRMRASIQLLGTLWYTCWVDAGQPDLENMPLEQLPVKPTEDEVPANTPVNDKMLGRPED